MHKIPRSETFDVIFIDCAKRAYRKVLDVCIRLVRIEGYIVADNITMDGCRDYKEAVLNNRLLETQLINIKDGLACSKRIGGG